MIMIESEGITEEVSTWRTDVAAAIACELGLEKVMFEAADPEVFGWYIKNYGPEVNLFVDHSQIVQLECLHRGIWGTNSLWGRVVTYPCVAATLVDPVEMGPGRQAGESQAAASTCGSTTGKSTSIANARLK